MPGFMYAHMKRLWIICSVMVVIICLLLICMVNLLKWSNKSMRLYCPPNILPDVSDPNYMKTVSACLAALGTEYLVQANIQQNQKERYVMMSTVVATTVAAFESDIATSLALDASRGEHKRAPASFFDGKNGGACNCLKDYDGEEISSEWFASLCQDFLKNESDDNTKEEVCGHCKQKKERLLTCTGCKSIKYCGSVCQRADWRNHKSFCKEKKKKASAGK